MRRESGGAEPDADGIAGPARDGARMGWDSLILLEEPEIELKREPG